MSQPSESVFRLPHYAAIDRKRVEWLNDILNAIMVTDNIATAIDVGCGIGYFTNVLKAKGLEIIGTDARSDNIAMARQSYPESNFKILDIESSKAANLGVFDLVLCLGLLYHLENPFQAVRNLYALTSKYLIIETRVAPYKRPFAVLLDEFHSEDQALSYIALVPSLTSLVRMLYKAGYENVYVSRRPPDHEEFKNSLFRSQMRTCLVASKSALELPQLMLMVDRKYQINWWHRWWFRPYRNLRHLAGQTRLGRALRRKMGR